MNTEQNKLSLAVLRCSLTEVKSCLENGAVPTFKLFHSSLNEQSRENSLMIALLMSEYSVEIPVKSYPVIKLVLNLTDSLYPDFNELGKQILFNLLKSNPATRIYYVKK